VIVTKLGQKFTQCPKSWLYTSAQHAAEVYGDYVAFKESGVLPYSGGLLDQDPRVLEAFDAITVATRATNEVIKKLNGTRRTT